VSSKRECFLAYVTRIDIDSPAKLFHYGKLFFPIENSLSSAIERGNVPANQSICIKTSHNSAAVGSEAIKCDLGELDGARAEREVEATRVAGDRHKAEGGETFILSYILLISKARARCFALSLIARFRSRGTFSHNLLGS
jgi:hypothetical protein